MKNRIKKIKLALIIMLVSVTSYAGQVTKGLAEYGIQIPLLVAGFFGGLLAVRKEGKSWQQNLLTLLTSASASTYLTPFLLELFNYTSPSAFAFFGFIVGSSSIKVVDWVTSKFFSK